LSEDERTILKQREDADRKPGRLEAGVTAFILISLMAGCGGGGNGGGGGTPQNPVPRVVALSPSNTDVGGNAFTLTVTGSNFIASSTVQWNSTPRTTAFVSSTQLTASITATDVATAGAASITVSNPAPGGGVSNTVTFSIDQPVPAVAALSPSSVSAGSTQFTLTVNGSSFVANSVVNWNGSPQTTVFMNNGQVTATILASDVTTAGTAQVTVFNPAPGGGTSNAATFTISPAVPTITSLSPASTLAGRSAFTLTVNGFNIASNSTVQWSGSPRSTTFASSNQLTAAIAAGDVASVGTFQVTVTTGFANSNAVSFSVVPVTSSLQITTQSLPPSADNKDYYFLLATSGGAGALTWSVTNGALPAGLSLDPSSGLISGTVSGVTSGFTVQVSDSASPPNIDLQNLSIAVSSLGRNDQVCLSPGVPGSDIATPISNGTLRASISPYGDVDTYSFTLTQTATNLSIETFAQRLDIGTNLISRTDHLDTVLELLDSGCNTLGLNDDEVVSTSPSVTGLQDSKIVVGPAPFPPSPVCTGQNSFGAPCADKTPPTSLSAGTYYIRIRDYRGDGRPEQVYDLTVSGIQ
jgi:Putative Ig domain